MSGANRNLASRFLGSRAFSLRSAHGHRGSRRIQMLAAGFTLIELILACSILFVLAAVAVPLARVAIKRRKEADLREKPARALFAGNPEGPDDWHRGLGNALGSGRH